jgi:hypothetical protein
MYSDPYGLFPFPWWLLNLPNTDECKQSEWDYCTTRCAPFRALGCYVSVSWKLKGIRGGEPIRSEQRSVNCNCEEPNDCPVARPKKGKPGQQSSSSEWWILPPWWWETVGALL